MTDFIRVERLLGRPELRRAVDLIFQRMERRQPLTGLLRLTEASDAERSALGALLGRGPTGSIRLDALEDVVRASNAAPSLAQAVEQLRGPVVVRRDAAARAAQDWDEAFAALDGLIAARPEYAGWATKVRASGLVRRLAPAPQAASRLLERTVAVLAALPVTGESLAVFAARVLGDAHGLDRDRPESTLVLSALRGDDPRRDADARRRTWAAAGIALDSLSSTVLALRPPLRASAAAAVAASGEPIVLTLRQLADERLVAPRSGQPVFVCENPSVVEAAADALGAGSAALVCVSGQPSVAAIRLLTRLRAGGAELRYHGDFDWGGLRIAAGVLARVPFVPWRFTSVDLDAAAGLAGEPLDGTPRDAPWDPRLRQTLERRGRRLEEEQVVQQLLTDLGD